MVVLWCHLPFGFTSSVGQTPSSVRSSTLEELLFCFWLFSCALCFLRHCMCVCVHNIYREHVLELPKEPRLSPHSNCLDRRHVCSPMLSFLYLETLVLGQVWFLWEPWKHTTQVCCCRERVWPTAAAAAPWDMPPCFCWAPTSCGLLSATDGARQEYWSRTPCRDAEPLWLCLCSRMPHQHSGTFLGVVL